MSFFTSDFTMNRKTCHMMATDNRELRHAPFETKQSENICVHYRIQSDPANFRLDVSMRVRRWSLPEPDTPARSMKSCIERIFNFARERPLEHRLYSTGQRTPMEEYTTTTMPGIAVPGALELPD
jgi:hypothetical protein